MRRAAALSILVAGCGSVVVPTPSTLEIEVVGPGTVAVADAVCPPSCSIELEAGTQVMLEARPTADAQVEGWSVEGCGVSPTCAVDLSADLLVTVRFAWPERTIRVSASGPGKVIGGEIDCGSACATSVPHGTEVMLSAEADEGSMLSAWGGACSAAAGAACTLTADADLDVSATFERARHRLSIQRAGTGAADGRVTSDVGGIDCPATCSATFEHGTDVVLSASSSPSARFDGWSGGGCSGAGACTVAITNAVEVSALFTDLTEPLSVSVDGSGVGTVTSTPLGISCGAQCDARFVAGTSITLIATPDGASRFQGWSGACAASMRSAACTFTLDSPRTVGATFHDNRVTAVALGLSHTCALLDPGLLRCFGSSEYGQLGYGNTVNRGDGVGPPANASDVALEAVTYVGAGHWHTCAIAGGALYCWGRNQVGQLGAGGMAEGANPTPLSIELGAGLTPEAVEGGAFHTCALAGGAVRCWGMGGDGALGYGDPNDRSTPGPAVPIAGTGAIQQLSTGGRHTCVLRAPGVVRCWGANAAGQLGTGDPNPRGLDATPAVDVDLGGAIAVQIGAGGNHTCARLMDGTIRCWGRNTEGQLGLGDTEPRGEEPGDLPIDEPVPLPAPATSLAVGNSHTCARLVDGRVYCWGWNEYGQLGHDDTVDRGDGLGPAATDATVPTPADVQTLLAGATNHTCAVRSSGAITCWGSGTEGALGYGSTAHRGDGLGPPAGAADVPLF